MKIDESLIVQAFTNNNYHFMQEMPEVIEAHDFSGKFEKKMGRLICANKKFGGHVWLERCIRYATNVAIIVGCLVMINFVSVKAFDFNIWRAVVTKTEEFLHINFQQQDEINLPQEDEINTQSLSFQLKIVKIPEGYTQQDFYSEDNMTVQHLTSENGTITYMESLITETADVNIASGNQDTSIVGNYEVNYVMGENSLTAFFYDEMFYHILEIQGEDANKDFADKIVEALEEQ